MSDELLGKIEKKIDKIDDRLNSIDITMVRQQVILDEHVKRSNTLEGLYHNIKEKDIEPLKNELNQIKGIFKFITMGSAFISAIIGILKLFRKI